LCFQFFYFFFCGCICDFPFGEIKAFLPYFYQAVVAKVGAGPFRGECDFAFFALASGRGGTLCLFVSFVSLMQFSVTFLRVLVRKVCGDRK
jgi:hypothetical protein